MTGPSESRSQIGCGCTAGEVTVVRGRNSSGTSMVAGAGCGDGNDTTGGTGGGSTAVRGMYSGRSKER